MKTLHSNLISFVAVAAMLVMAAGSGRAQSASIGTISFQGALTGADGQPMPDGVYDLTFRFWDGPAPGGNPVSTNILVSGVSLTSGVVATAIPVNPTWFDGQVRYLGVSVNSSSELLPRALITAVPYALSAGALTGMATVGRLAISAQAPGEIGQLLVTSDYSGRIRDPAAEFQIHDSGISGTRGLFLNYKTEEGSFDVLRSYNRELADPYPFRVKDNGSVFSRGEFEIRKLTITAGATGEVALVVAAEFNDRIRDPGADFRIYNPGIRGTRGVYINYKTGDTSFDLLRCYNRDRTDPYPVRITDDGLIATRVLQITGGADVAENITVTDAKAQDEFEPEAGMVVSIDASGNRKFKLSDEPYDRKRVGIISGGNGLKPGLVLRDEGNPQADGEHPVALTGQVWCHADASFGTIKPGDLLTTSATPGHAMRVSDLDKARFAVLGQALTELKEGRGWVQVLVRAQ